jgi:hypothetical protein
MHTLKFFAAAAAPAVPELPPELPHPAAKAMAADAAAAYNALYLGHDLYLMVVLSFELHCPGSAN